MHWYVCRYATNARKPCGAQTDHAHDVYDSSLRHPRASLLKFICIQFQSHACKTTNLLVPISSRYSTHMYVPERWWSAREPSQDADRKCRWSGAQRTLTAYLRCGLAACSTCPVVASSSATVPSIHPTSSRAACPELHHSSHAHRSEARGRSLFIQGPAEMSARPELSVMLADGCCAALIPPDSAYLGLT